jgi:hypothetical protein
MATTKVPFALRTLTLSAIAASVPIASGAEITDEWRFGAAIYGYFPSVSATASIPTRGARTFDVDADTLIDHLHTAFMGSFEVSRGRWGAFTDVMYFDVSGSRTGTGVLAVSGLPLPPGVSVDASLDLKTTVWTLAGIYHAIATPETVVDVFAGGRMLNLRTQLGWQFSTDFGPFVGPARAGTSEVTQTNWDAIVGVKGRIHFGESRRWFAPYYLDVGSGESKLTWQAMAGVGYAFGWGEVIAGWRHLDYEFKSSDKVQDLAFDGPAIGVAFRW